MLSLAAAAALAATAHGAALRNVLMITVDGETRPASSPHPTCRWAAGLGGWGAAADLRPQLNAAYDMTETITPNIDKLAKSATVFHRAYCQQAVRRPPSRPPPLVPAAPRALAR